jgi:hypothetical protein
MAHLTLSHGWLHDIIEVGKYLCISPAFRRRPVRPHERSLHDEQTSASLCLFYDSTRSSEEVQPSCLQIMTSGKATRIFQLQLPILIVQRFGHFHPPFRFLERSSYKISNVFLHGKTSGTSCFIKKHSPFKSFGSLKNVDHPLFDLMIQCLFSCSPRNQIVTGLGNPLPIDISLLFKFFPIDPPGSFLTVLVFNRNHSCRGTVTIL